MDSAALRVSMAGGYLAVWIGFSLLATFAQGGLGETVLTPMMTVRSSVVAVALLVTAAQYQITPVVNVPRLRAARRCRSSCATRLTPPGRSAWASSTAYRLGCCRWARCCCRLPEGS